MPRISSAVAALGLCSIALHAAPAQHATSVSQGPLRTSGALVDSLRAYATTMGTMFHARDAEGVVRLYGDSSIYVHINNGSVGSWAQTARNLRGSAAAGGGPSPLTFTGEPKVIVLDDNAAVVYYDLHIDAIGGGSAQDGVWTGVLRREPDGWKIIHSHASTHAAPPRAP